MCDNRGREKEMVPACACVVGAALPDVLYSCLGHAHLVYIWRLGLTTRVKQD